MQIIKIIEKMQRVLFYRMHKYKGHTVNVGGKMDDYGVYTLASEIPDDAIVLSFGVGTDTSFE
jgi:hypothetical protein